MAGEQLDTILNNFGAMAGGWSEETSLDVMRSDFEKFFAAYPEAEGARSEIVQAGVPCERVVTPDSNPEHIIILLHGGGFSMGSARAHRPYASHLAAKAKAAVYSVDYRLAPEHPFPAAHDDAYAVYQHLLGHGVDPKNISVCGDSAGATLALATLIKARDEDSAMPGSCVLVSPWADMLCKGASYDVNAAIDPISNKDMAIGMGAGYLGDKGDANSLIASPAYAEMSGFPPMLILAGEREVFLDDARQIESQMKRAGGSVKLRIEPGMIHQWPLHVGKLDEADRSIEEIGAFMSSHWAGE